MLTDGRVSTLSNERKIEEARGNRLRIKVPNYRDNKNVQRNTNLLLSKVVPAGYQSYD